ncbi:MAG: hypothetical protein HKN76_16320 [Saprospiraceae bacterium]|nr:hypothetical protein [Saprospiraceae bacterium]
MTLKNTLLVLMVIGSALIISCNPDCDSATNGNISIDSGSAILEGRENEVLLRSNPPNFLRGRKVFIDDPIAGPPELMEVSADFNQELDGLIVTIPEEAALVSTPNMYVDDPDCSSNVLFVDPLSIRSEEFFFTSDAFVVPPVPIIIIPAPAVTPPVAVTNAWVTPYDRAYCIWFVPLKDGTEESSQLRVFDPETEEIFGPPESTGSREFIVCDQAAKRSKSHGNPVSGIIDKEANFIQIQIDRTRNGAGVEQFTGMFIEPENIPDSDEWRNGGGCAPNTKRKTEFMLLTSLSTGQQIMLVKAS